MAKLNRERRLLERRHAKQAKKDARKRAAAEQGASPGDTHDGDDGGVVETDAVVERDALG